MSARRRARISAALVAGGALVAGALAVSPATSVAADGSGPAPAVATSPTTAAADGYTAVVRRTAYGVPHIRAKSFGDLGFGNGFVQAEDNVCIIAEAVVSASGNRSEHFGATPENVQSDLFYRNAIAGGAVERLLDGPRDGIDSPSPRARQLVRGFVAGYNSYLRTKPVTDPTCQGAPWVREISDLEYWRTVYASLVRAGSRALQGPILAAVPPGQTVPAKARPSLARATQVLESADGVSSGIGSNAFGLGSRATRRGGGMVLGNPHFPWDGPERFYRLHLTIPGKYDVEGVALVGNPMVQIGHNRTMGWSHTVSTARRFVFHRLQLVPGEPTSYVHDGTVHRMAERTVSVGEVSKTFYETRFGPVVAIPGQFPWDETTAYAMTDINATNARAVDGWLAMGRAKNVRRLKAALDRYQHLPWVNVIAADARGEALYADHSVVPRVTAQMVDSCITPLHRFVYSTTGIAVLDGSTSACDLGVDPDAAVPGILGPRHLPVRFRKDYVTNSNNSHWLANPEKPLTGFARIIGDEGTPRTLRTRLGLMMVQQRLAGTDDLPGRRFTTRRLWQVMFNNRVLGGELVRDDLVAACRRAPTATASNGERVDLTAACDALAGWDLHANLDSTGMHLFREFVAADGLHFADSFDVERPVRTPRRLDSARPEVLRALADAVQRLDGVALDARLGEVQTEPRGRQQIPIHGNVGETGAFNAISALLRPGDGYREIEHGASYVMAVEFGRGGPRGRQILTYSQSANPRSPYYADQTRLYSRKGWDTVKFTNRQIKADPALVRYVVREAPAG